MASSSKGSHAFSSIEKALGDIKNGRIIIIVDDRSRSNEGVFFQAAEKVTAASVNFFITHARGMMFLPCTGKRLTQLKIPMISSETSNTMSNVGALAVSIDARSISGTGISASDRALTVKTFIDPSTRPEDIAIPGHIFPLRAVEGGVLERAGHTEAAVELALFVADRPILALRRQYVEPQWAQQDVRGGQHIIVQSVPVVKAL